MNTRKKSAEADNDQVETIPMTRNVEQYPEGPHEADVHPDEVDNYKAGGWVEA